MRPAGIQRPVAKAGPIAKLKGLDPSEILVKGANAQLKSSSSRFLGEGPQEKLERLSLLKSTQFSFFLPDLILRFHIRRSPLVYVSPLIFYFYSIFSDLCRHFLPTFMGLSLL